MKSDRERIRFTLQSSTNVKYRVSMKPVNKGDFKKQAFMTMIKRMQEIEDRKDFMIDELGIDVTGYEDKFFQVIESLLKLTFSTNQLEMIQLYLYQLLPDKEWDGTIMLKKDKKEQRVPFRTSEEVWNVIKEL